MIGLGCIAGIGFTMSLFIGALAFSDPTLAAPVRVGVYAGSIVAAIAGLVILNVALRRGKAKRSGRDETRPFIAPESKYRQETGPKFD